MGSVGSGVTTAMSPGPGSGKRGAVGRAARARGVAVPVMTTATGTVVAVERAGDACGFWTTGRPVAAEVGVAWGGKVRDAGAFLIHGNPTTSTRMRSGRP